MDEEDESRKEHAGEGLYSIASANMSGTSLDSEALLDHRGHQPMRLRRASTIAGAMTNAPLQSPFATTPGGTRHRAFQGIDTTDFFENPFDNMNERAPLLGEPRPRGSQTGPSSYGASQSVHSRPKSHGGSTVSSNTRRAATAFSGKERYNINNPPSVPNSPNFGGVDRIDMTLGDVMIRDDIDLNRDGPRRPIDDDMMSDAGPKGSGSRPGHLMDNAEQDVCFPPPDMSEMGDEEMHHRGAENRGRVRRRRNPWPDLSIFEEWKQIEKEDRTEERRAKTITEPQLINGRLRPVRKGWYETDEELPYRFTYFNEEFQSTIHSQTISELCQPGGGFRELFNPEPRVLSDDETETEDEAEPASLKPHRSSAAGGDEESKGSKVSTRQPSLSDARKEQTLSPSLAAAGGTLDRGTSSGLKSPEDSAPQKMSRSTTNESKSAKPQRYGERPVWWLDVLCPTEAEMKVISKAFGIHPLTAEDIMLEEAREKVELFRHYYFVNYRTFDQDINSANYLEPVNMYVVVFREGVLSFHFSVTPHPANVRRRIRQLRDYLILSSDWISYALIDDITDVFQPLIQNIEDEVDEIDEAILRLHSGAEKRLKEEQSQSQKHEDTTTVADSSSDMLRRVGDCRKRVMSLYRLLGNKADVIKGFAKRCNERWEVAPRSEIGLYLGDIQDHIVTMTSNLGHYEKILARSHGNYLAQINIRMNERQEQTADVLGKLTVLGTIVLPMNIITGLWGMNVWVPGQEHEGNLAWFAWITAGLFLFGLACFLIAKRVYGIV